MVKKQAKRKVTKAIKKITFKNRTIGVIILCPIKA